MPHDLMRYKAEENRLSEISRNLHNKLSMDKLIHILPLMRNSYYVKEEIVFGTETSNSSQYQFVELEDKSINKSIKAKETAI